MAITTFDTHKFVRRLEKAGVPLEQAEVQAEVLTEAFTVNLESLVTKEFLQSRLAEFRSGIDTRFAEQTSYIDTRFAEQTSYIDTRFAEQTSYIDTRFTEQKAYMDTRFAELNSRFENRFRFFSWTQAIVIAAVIIPLITPGFL